MADFTPQEQEYLDYRRMGYGPITSAREIGSTAREMSAYIAANPAFADAVDEAVNESIERVENKVREAGQDGDLIAARFILESHRPEAWAKPDREVTLRLGLPDEMDLPALTKRLELARKNDAIDVESREVEPDGEHLAQDSE